MSYTFKTELFGLTVEVEGEFSPEEPQTMVDPGCSAEFEINTIKHAGEDFELDSLDAFIFEDIEQEAFDAASDGRGDY